MRRLSGPLHVRARTSNGAVRQVNLVDPLTAKQLAEEDMGRRKEAARKQVCSQACAMRAPRVLSLSTLRLVARRWLDIERHEWAAMYQVHCPTASQP